MLLAPTSLRRLLRRPFRCAVFARAWREFAADPSGAAERLDLLRRLRRGWDNPWTANLAALQQVLRELHAARGPVLECGSGLTTLLAAAASRGQPVVALEHDVNWRARIAHELRRRGLDRVALPAVALRSYGDFDWYDAAPDTIPAGTSLVICDGPPGTTFGGRYGLLPVLRGRLAPGCRIVLDDAQRPDEQATLRRWEREFGTRSERADSDGRIVIVHLPA